ncbi:hypothetical protein JJQ72_07315 [Paenibacillus sp. F411]|uniref:Uncharacterized protein n=1 Tax=Paenibacillus algicola TaxID=2565926 RepID=A0A4P8XNC1_9BACL|nr:hypothetical protein [Paenibacillus sp. F411]MBO2943781.1 hypothetical protein [Paenibacillus sp. F411]QCT04068.1 hypothetical protein E6C60_3357 [Paenibacillus algicola]
MDEMNMYCIVCCRVVNQSGKIFRTGYFKHNIPIGLCEECAAQKCQDPSSIASSQPGTSRPEP